MSPAGVLQLLPEPVHQRFPADRRPANDRKHSAGIFRRFAGNAALTGEAQSGNAQQAEGDQQRARGMMSTANRASQRARGWGNHSHVVLHKSVKQRILQPAEMQLSPASSCGQGSEPGIEQVGRTRVDCHDEPGSALGTFPEPILSQQPRHKGGRSIRPGGELLRNRTIGHLEQSRPGAGAKESRMVTDQTSSLNRAMDAELFTNEEHQPAEGDHGAHKEDPAVESVADHRARGGTLGDAEDDRGKGGEEQDRGEVGGREHSGLPPDIEVVRIDGGDEVEQSGNDDELGAVVGGHQLYSGLSEGKDARHEIREAGADVREEPEHVEGVAGIGQVDLGLHGNAESKHQTNGGEQQDGTDPVPGEQVSGSGNQPAKQKGGILSPLRADGWSLRFRSHLCTNIQAGAG